MQPYVIRQGDYLAKLAYRFGFEADSVWTDPANARLREARPNPNILSPGDLLWIPEPEPPVWHPVTLGTTNTFTVHVPTTSITLRFLDKSLASQAVTIEELPHLTGLTTDADGSVSFQVPVFADVVTVVFTSSGATHECRIGHVDPIDTLSGVFCRLQNLGYLAVDVALDGTDIESIREALRAFNADRGAGPSSAPPSSSVQRSSARSPSASPLGGSPSDGSSSGGSPQSDAGPPPSSPPPLSSPTDSNATDDAGSAWPEGCPFPESDDPSGGGDDAPPPLWPMPSSLDNAGLADNGTLDSSTAQALLQAHGS